MSAPSTKSGRKLAAKILQGDIPRESATKNKKAARDPQEEHVPAEMSVNAPEESSDPSGRVASPVRELEPGESRFSNESEEAASSQHAIEGEANSRGPSEYSESTNSSPTSWEGRQFNESWRHDPTLSRMDAIEAQQSEILALVRQMVPRQSETLATPSVRVSGMAMVAGSLSSQRPYTIPKKQGAIYGGSLAEDFPDSNSGDMVVGTTVPLSGARPVTRCGIGYKCLLKIGYRGKHRNNN